MPAQIIQQNETPFERRPIDPVTLDIIENALRNARVEMDATLVRTAMSPGIREQGDAFPLIADHEGRMIVGQSARGDEHGSHAGQHRGRNDPHAARAALGRSIGAGPFRSEAIHRL